MILTGLILILMTVSTKEINLGEHVIPREQAIESGIYYLIVALSLLLFIGISLSINNDIKGKLIVKNWGFIYSLIFIPFVFLQFGILSTMLTIIMVAYSAVWYYGANKIVTGK